MKNNLYEIFSNTWLKDCDSIWLYSDPHFGDFDSYCLRGLVNITAYDDINSYYYSSFEEEETKRLDEMQIKNINAKVGKNACLIILGDVGDIECVKKLKAKRKILIMGNHDKGASNYKRDIIPASKVSYWRVEFYGFWPPACFNKEITIEEAEEKFGKGSVKDIIKIYEQEDNHLFDEVYEGPLMINDRLILSHEPIDVPDYMFNIHGHCHSLPYVYDSKHRNVCAEALEYTPISLTRLLKLGVLKNTKSIHRDYIDNRLETLAKKGSD